MKRIAVVAITILLATLAPAAAAQAAEKPVVQCEFTPTPDNPAARPVRPPSADARATGTVTATIVTNYGVLAVRMDRAGAPCAVHNFAHLASRFFYTLTQCFRLTNSARLGVLQCGDIYEVEKGGPGYRFPDEVDGTQTYPRGTVAMGNQGPGTNGSEFFIVHSFANIAPNYTVFGKVTRGMEVLDRMVAAGIVPGPNGELDGPPAHPIRILHIAVSARS